MTEPSKELVPTSHELVAADGTRLIEVMRGIYAAIEDALDVYADDPVALSLGTIALKDLAKQHSVVKDKAEKLLAKNLGKGVHDLGEGIGRVEVRSVPSRTGWKNKELVDDVLKQFQARGWTDDVGELLAHLFEVYTFSGAQFKSNKEEGTGLAALGLDKSDYCSTSWTDKPSFPSKPESP